MDALTYTHFGFTYAGAAAPVLDDVCWSVPQGAFALLVGNTGSGKTTLLRCAKTGIAPVGERAGSIAVCGREQRVGERALDVGYVFQSPENQIVCDAVWHELAFGLENAGTEQDAMRRRVAEVAHFFGIEPWFRRATHELSGGQKQLLNLASVLVMQPRVLLLDEPTAQLDPVAQSNFLHALFRINRELGITVVVATHAPEAMVDYATCAACVVDGRAEEAELRELRAGWAGGGAQSQVSCGGRGTRAPSCSVGSAPCADRQPDSADALWAGGKHRMLALRSRGGSFACGDEGKSEAVVSLSGVYFRYARTSGWVLRGLDLDLEAGGVHALVGGNGCGKSTLLRLVAGVLKPERGRVRNSLRARQALLPQDPKALLVRDAVREELMEWSRSASYGATEVNAAMERFGIAHLAAQHPYDTSGGQQQKIALAKILLTRPQLLLLDEPTKGLDAPSRLEIARILRTLRDEEGCTVVLVTHDLAFASRVADTMTMLFDGEVAASQPAREFCEENLFYRPRPDRFTRLWDACGEEARS